MAAYTGPFPYTNAGTVTAINVINTTFSGNVGNSGTITGPLTVTNSRINGEIFDNGFIGGGILIDSASIVSAGSSSAIAIFGARFAGGITNAGTIASGEVGIDIDGTSTFSGGITNTGTISSFYTAIEDFCFDVPRRHQQQRLD